MARPGDPSNLCCTTEDMRARPSRHPRHSWHNVRSPSSPGRLPGQPDAERRRSHPHAPVHLHHEGPAQGHPAGQGDPEGHLAVVLPRRQDRRPRRERRRQVHAAADHGRRRQGLRRRGVPGRRARASATCRRSPCSTRRRTCSSTSRRRSPRSANARSTRFEEISAQTTSRDDDALDELARAAGPDRRRERVGPRPARRDRDGRAAPAAGRRRRDDALGRREAPRGAVPAAAAAARPAAARRAHEPPRRRVGGVARALPAGVPGHASSPSPTTATSSTTSPAGSSSSTAARASRGRATTRPGSSRRRSGSRRRRRRPRRGSARSSASSSGSAWRRARGRPRARRASRATRSCWPRSRRRRSATTSARSRSRPGPRLGDLVVEAKGLRKGYGDKLLIDDLDFTLPRGGIVGVIGPNGAGKTTLFRMIVGPGEARRGRAQGRRDGRALVRRPEPRDARSATRTVVGGDLRRRQGPDHGRQARGRTRAPTRRPSTSAGRDQQKKVEGPLGRRAQPPAPGEAAARAAATCCCSTSRPTTSTSTRCARSRRRCSSFAGCAVVISHDRWFLDRIATHILAFEGDSQVVWFEGNYQDYEADRKRRLGADADQPAPHQVPQADALTVRLRTSLVLPPA